MARLAGAAGAIRQKLGTPIPLTDESRLERFLAPAQAAIASEAWHAEPAAGYLGEQLRGGIPGRASASRAGLARPEGRSRGRAGLPPGHAVTKPARWASELPG